MVNLQISGIPLSKILKPPNFQLIQSLTVKHYSSVRYFGIMIMKKLYPEIWCMLHCLLKQYWCHKNCTMHQEQVAHKVIISSKMTGSCSSSYYLLFYCFIIYILWKTLKNHLSSISTTKCLCVWDVKDITALTQHMAQCLALKPASQLKVNNPTAWSK